jgi:5-methylcytosine-specific restriction endonuclease McrA
MRFPKPAKRSPKPRKRVKRSVRPHAVRQTKRAAQERKLDALWGRWILLGEPLCWNCQRNRATDPAHIVSRRYKRTRWQIANGLPLCRTCHDRFTRQPKAWDIAVSRMYPATFSHLWKLARNGPMPDLDQAARELAG